MPAQVLNEWVDLENGLTQLKISSKAIGTVEVLVESEIVPQLRIHCWGYDKKSQRFSYGEAYTRIYLHRKIAEIYEKGAVGVVYSRDAFDLRRSNIMWKPA